MPRTRNGKHPRKGEGDSREIAYREMLEEAISMPSAVDDDARNTKKRRIGGRLVEVASGRQSPTPASNGNNDLERDGEITFETTALPAEAAQQQRLESFDEDETESEVDWEEVDVESGQRAGEESPREIQITLQDLQSNGTPKRSSIKRKPISSEERRLRLAIHKVHLLCLLENLYIWNHWINDESLQATLYLLLNDRIQADLHPGASRTQFERSRSFVNGLQQASDLFRGRYRVTSRGIARPEWTEDPAKLAERRRTLGDLPMEKEDFIASSKDLRGTRDVGAHLFCALLRSAGVMARLVCSLQVLSYRFAAPSTGPTMQYSAVATDEGAVSTENIQDEQTSPSGRIRESKYPVYWIEAFNNAIQRWLPVDPLVTRTVAKISKYEPPLGDRFNCMHYVVAFEEDGSIHDVTRRYAKYFNSKTRRYRVEATPDGSQWWQRVLSFYRRQAFFDRDELEAAELTAKEASEPMPRSVQDFKDHPYYVLERQLRRHEVIQPKREVGKVSTGGRGHQSTMLEPVFRRQDVQRAESADKWFRKGRVIIKGEQPVKTVRARARQGVDVDDNSGSETRDQRLRTLGLYVVAQTKLYEPPPVLDGEVPRNQYGNVDVYVPSMIPQGGAHIQHKLAAQALRGLRIDYADAVGGFTFQGRHASAVINGVVVAAEHVDAVRERIVAMEQERRAAEFELRTVQALRMWKRLLVGLRIRERIEGYTFEAGPNGRKNVGAEKQPDADDEQDAGGGFLPEAADEDQAAASSLDTKPEAETLTSTTVEEASAEDTRQTTSEEIPIIVPVVYPPPPLPESPSNPTQNTPSFETLFDEKADLPVKSEHDAVQVAAESSVAGSGNSAEARKDDGPPLSDDIDRVGSTPESKQINNKEEPTHEEEEERDEFTDNGSLISHDPEDEDMDFE